MKMEAVGSSETSVNTFNITRRINPEDQQLIRNKELNFGETPYDRPTLKCTDQFCVSFGLDHLKETS
jgi:hypothetical protein